MGALQMVRENSTHRKQAYYVFAYDDSVSTLGPDVRVTTDSRREGDVLVARGLRGHGSAIRSTALRFRFTNANRN